MADFLAGVVVFLETPPLDADDFEEDLGVLPAELLVLRGLRVMELGFIYLCTLFSENSS